MIVRTSGHIRVRHSSGMLTVSEKLGLPESWSNEAFVSDFVDGWICCLEMGHSIRMPFSRAILFGGGGAGIGGELASTKVIGSRKTKINRKCMVLSLTGCIGSVYSG